jgi:hypothetical protein
MRVLACVCLACGVLAGGSAAAGEAVDLETLVKESDLVVFGQVIDITQGKLDPAALKIGVKTRTDVAALAVVEVLKGDPDLQGKRIDIAFPGFPRKNELTIEPRQKGVWLLTKADRPNRYLARTQGRFLPAKRLGDARRAVRAAAGLKRPGPSAKDRTARVAELVSTLTADEPVRARRLAAYRLGELGDLAAVPALVKALEDDAPSVRLSADLALRKITGHRMQTDFRDGTAEARARGVRAWHDWWETHKGKKRQAILTEAVRAGSRPLPDLPCALEGLAEYGEPALLPLFRETFDSAISSKNERLAAVAAEYFARVKDRRSVPRLAALIDGTYAWPGTSLRAAAVVAIGRIVGREFGAGAAAAERCREWWREHKAAFR